MDLSDPAHLLPSLSLHYGTAGWDTGASHFVAETTEVVLVLRESCLKLLLLFSLRQPFDHPNMGLVVQSAS